MATSWARSGIRQAYLTGRGSVTMRARAEIEKRKGDKEAIVVTEIPFQVNKARVIEKIAELWREKKIDGITEVRDESDRRGMRIVVDVRKGESAQVILNQLYKQTQLQDTFGISLLAIVHKRPAGSHPCSRRATTSSDSGGRSSAGESSSSSARPKPAPTSCAAMSSLSTISTR